MWPLRRILAHEVAHCARRLKGSGVVFGHGATCAMEEAVWLVCAVLGIAPDDFARLRHRPLTSTQVQAVRVLLAHRITSRTPLAYLLREAWFAGRAYYVDERVLIPRSPLGEHIANGLRPWLQTRPATILDLGCGSGCIGIALALAFPQSRVVLSDVSIDALAVAEINARRHGVLHRTTIVQSDLFSALTDQRFDLIVSNPPYVNDTTMAALPREYRREPALALTAGEDGLRFLVPILQQSADHLHPHGALFVEAGSARGALERRFPRTPFIWLTSASDEDTVLLLYASELAGLRDNG